MSKIEVHGICCKKIKNMVEYVAKKVIVLMNQPDVFEIAIKFVSPKEIKLLNKETRGIDKVTDVLSYPSTNLKVGEVFEFTNEFIDLQTEDSLVHFGDMAICFKQAKKQAKEYGVSVFSEIKKLVIHSMLHLMGYDHIEDVDYEIMQKKEIELDQKIKV